MNHEISQNRGGEGMDSWIQPVCSCGWQGRKEYASSDWQCTNVRDQEVRHLQEANSSEPTITELINKRSPTIREATVHNLIRTKEIAIQLLRDMVYYAEPIAGVSSEAEEYVLPCAIFEAAKQWLEANHLYEQGEK